MSTKTTAQKNARLLQQLAEEELGAKPKLMTCHNIIRDAGAAIPGLSREEYLSSLYVANVARLKASAEDRKADR